MTTSPRNELTWEKVPHNFPEPSSHKTNDVSVLRSWHSSLSPSEDQLLCWTERPRGLPLLLKYEKGDLKSAIACDGQIGEDIMANVVMMRGVHRQVPRSFTGSIYGDIFITYEMLRHFPAHREPLSAVLDASRRVGREDARVCQYLTVKCYDLSQSFRTEAEKFFFLKGLDLMTPNHGFWITIEEAVHLTTEYKKTLSNEMNYEIEGLLFTAGQDTAPLLVTFQD